MDTYQVFDCQIKYNKNRILNDLNQIVIEKEYFQPVITLNITMLPEYEKEPELFSWLKQNVLFTPDGVSISLYIFLKYFRRISRYPGIDMVHDLFNNFKGYRVALIGASSDNLEKASEFFQLTFNHHLLVFSADGFNDFNSNLMNDLVHAKPDIILIGMGCPKQDQFMYELSKSLRSGIAIGVGGVFDVWSNTIQRAPIFFRYVGLEWLYRIIKQPFRFYRVIKSLKYFIK